MKTLKKKELVSVWMTYWGVNDDDYDDDDDDDILEDDETFMFLL